MEQRLSRLEETYERGFSRLEETYERGFSRLEEMIAELCEQRGLLMRRIDGDEEQYPVMDDETDLLGTRMIVDPNLENQEDSEQIVILEEESIPQSKVPIANSEILKSIEPGKVDLGLEKLEYVVLNENLEQEWDQKNIKEKTDVDGDVERDQKLISDTKTVCAHQVFVKMPSKEKRMKHLKAWKFKFKSTSKRSRLMDNKFSFVDATVLLNKDPQEIIWGCVNKEFKETVAGCGRKRVDRFRLVDEKESRPEVMDMNQTFLYHHIGHCVDILLVPKLLVHDKEGAILPQRSRSLTISDCSDRSSRANRVWKPGGLLCVQDHSGGSILMITQRFHGLRLQRIIYMDMKFQEVIEDDVLSVMVCLCVPNKKFEAELEIYDCETKKHMLLLMKLANRVWDPGGSNSQND